MLGGEPTSVTVKGDHAFVGVNTSEDFVHPSGHVAVVDIAGGKVVAKCDVGGQPDSVALSPDGAFLAVAIENERNEDLNDGVIPQLPAGHLASFRVTADASLTNCGSFTKTDLTGLADIAPSDPEPEFVSINADNQAVVTLQENNYIVMVELETNTVVRHFSAGTSSVSAVDSKKDGVISMSDEMADLRREPDAVAWLDDKRFAIANEGDYQGGSRGFSIFDSNGSVLFDSGNATEHLAASVGHYPEKRSGKKGTEPEGIAVGTFAGQQLVFVGMERANLIAVYRNVMTGSQANGRMDFVQALPSGGVGPEGLLAIPERNLMVIANEEDSADDGIRSTLSIYRYGAAEADAPRIVSVASADGAPIGWGALSGLAANPSDPTILYAVSDSFYNVASIFTIDVSGLPARIVARRPVVRAGEPVANLDLEGIAAAPDGTFWLASEGKPDVRPSLLLHVKADGEVARELTLPESIEAHIKKHGLEGVALDGDRLYIAVQREWKDDPKGLTKIIVHDLKAGSWGVLHYPLDAPESPAGGWVGLSEITALGDGELAVIERDNKPGEDAAIKRVYRFSVKGLSPAAPGGKPPVVSKILEADLLPALKRVNGWTADKIEGFTVAADGKAYAVTDNDGVDNSPGETVFLRLGPRQTAMAGQ
jgi:hypothetical protein